MSMRAFRYHTLNQEKGKSPKESSVFDHIVYTGHDTSFDDFETLAKECDEFRLILRKSLWMLRDDPQLNRHVKFIPLKLFS